METFADGIFGNLATREDVGALRGDLEKTEAALRSDMKALRGDMEKSLDKTAASLRSEMETNRHKLQRVMTTQLGVVAGAAVAILVALDKLL